MSNDDLIAAWMRKLPGRTPQGQELSAFALGVEVGAERYAETWDALQFAVKNYQDMSSKKDRATAAVYQFHYAMKDAGWHPGRTADNLCDVIRAKGHELQDLRGRLDAAIEALNFIAEHLSSDWPDRCQSNVLAARRVLGPNARLTAPATRAPKE